MLWFFSNGKVRLKVGTRLDTVTGEYIVDIERPNAAVEVHRFADESRCSEFLSAFENQLTVDGWISDGVTITGQTTTH
jgi:hypothetical protein